MLRRALLDVSSPSLLRQLSLGLFLLHRPCRPRGARESHRRVSRRGDERAGRLRFGVAPRIGADVVAANVRRPRDDSDATSPRRRRRRRRRRRAFVRRRQFNLQTRLFRAPFGAK